MLIAGCDEVGRGSWAGPVIAAVVILTPNQPIRGLADSKKLTALQRERLTDIILQHAFDWAIAQASVAEIDQLNILQATLLAMHRAAMQLQQPFDAIWVDGQYAPNWSYPTRCIIQGDQTAPTISAAAILAKTYRDALMQQFDAIYPQYGFGQHKGYGTAQHQTALGRWGITPIHRRSFAPIRRQLAGVANQDILF